jgi:quaternary ammonium compound-resistance protein SugE
MKYTEGMTKIWPTACMFGTMVVSFGLLSLSLKSIPLGTAYAVWCSIGIAGTALWGIFMLGESTSAIRIICILLIFLGVIGLKLGSTS